MIASLLGRPVNLPCDKRRSSPPPARPWRSSTAATQPAVLPVATSSMMPSLFQHDEIAQASRDDLERQAVIELGGGEAKRCRDGRPLGPRQRAEELGLPGVKHRRHVPAGAADRAHLNAAGLEADRPVARSAGLRVCRLVQHGRGAEHRVPGEVQLFGQVEHAGPRLAVGRPGLDEHGLEVTQLPRYQRHLRGGQRRRVHDDRHAVAGVRDGREDVHVVVRDLDRRLGGR